MNSSYIVDDYVDVFSQKVLAAVRADKLTGDDLLHMTNIPQLNYHVLWQIYKYWKTQMALWQLPYFDYTHPVVDSKMKEAMREISMHILVGKGHLKPMLRRAAHLTLLLALSPYAAYKKIFLEEPKAFSARYLQEIKKYFKINTSILQTLIAFCKETPTTLYTPTEWAEKLEKARLEAPRLDDPAQYLDLFDKIHSDPNIHKASTLLLLRDISEDTTKDTPVVSEAMLDKKRRAMQQMDDDLKKELARELFHDNQEDFQLALHHALSQKNFDHSVEFLVRKYAKKNQWNLEKENVKHLFKILFKSF